VRYEEEGISGSPQYALHEKGNIEKQYGHWVLMLVLSKPIQPPRAPALPGHVSLNIKTRNSKAEKEAFVYDRV
jgi:hypothetical protein